MTQRRISCVHVPDRFIDRFLDSFDVSTSSQRKAAAAAQRMIAGDIDSLVLIGGPGCGKSTLLAITANELADVGKAEGKALRDQLAAMDPNDRDHFDPITYRELSDELDRVDKRNDRRCPRWLNVGRTIVDLKAEMSAGGHDLVDELRTLRETRGLLVLDDVGRERISEWSAEVLYAIVSARYDDRLPTAISSNVAAVDLQRLGYGAIMSRLADRGVILELSGADYRLRRSA